MDIYQISGIISQLIVLYIYYTASKTLIPNIKLKSWIKLTIVSPIFVHFFAGFMLIIAGIVYSPIREASDIFSYYAEIGTLVLSFAFSYFYALLGPKKHMTLMVYTYNICYMLNLCFSMSYKTIPGVILFSFICPIIICCISNKYLQESLHKMIAHLELAKVSILLIPFMAEVLLSCRLGISAIQHREISINPAFTRYSEGFLIIGTAFGYLVISFAFLTIYLVSNNITAYEEIKNRSIEIEEANQRTKKISFEMLNALVNTIEAKDEYTNGHSLRVAKYSQMIAEQLKDKYGFDDKYIENIYRYALLHDIGKIAVPDSIINKPSKLSDEEYEIIKTHSEKGASILKDIEELPELYIGALYHHERWDGKGYPNHKKADDIPFMARIIAVADAYDAMTSKRSYRPPMAQEIVKEEILKGSGTQFCPEIADVMVDIINADTNYDLKQVAPVST